MTDSSTLPQANDTVTLVELCPFDYGELSRDPMPYAKAQEKKATDPDRFEIVPFGRTSQPSPVLD